MSTETMEDCQNFMGRELTGDAAYQEYLRRYDKGDVWGVVYRARDDGSPRIRPMHEREWKLCAIVHRMMASGQWSEDKVVQYVYGHVKSELKSFVVAWAQQCIANECPLNRIALAVKDRMREG